LVNVTMHLNLSIYFITFIPYKQSSLLFIL